METYVKPAGLTPNYGAQFQDVTIVKAYRHREPYSTETFEILSKLAQSQRPAIADIGCGPGDLTIGLSRFAQSIDAVDLSREMIEEAKRSHSNLTNINWIQCAVENAPLKGPYDLITAGDSVHWMEWSILFQKMKSWLKPGHFFCVVGRWYHDKEWWDPSFQKIIDTYSTNKDFKKYDIIEELKKSGYVKVQGSAKTAPFAFTQSVEDLIEAFHSRNGFSRDRMGCTADAFDREAARHLNRYAKNGQLTLSSVSYITWMTLE